MEGAAAAAAAPPAAKMAAGHARRLSLVSPHANIAAAGSSSSSPPAPVAADSGADAAAAAASVRAASAAGSNAAARGRSSRLSSVAARRIAAPCLRPKKTHAGLEEKMEATGYAYGVYVHWDEYAGHHVHVSPPEIDAMHADEVLMVPSGNDAEREERVVCPEQARLSCSCRIAASTAPAAASASSAAAPAQLRKGQQQQRHARHCIPLYRYQPKLCGKSRRIVDEYRETRLLQVWQKLDLRGENVVDFLSLRWLPAATAVCRSTRGSAADAAHAHAAGFPSASRVSADAAAAELPLVVGGVHGALRAATGRTHVELPAALHHAAGLLLPGESAEGGRDADERLCLSPVEERFVEAALIPRFFMTAMLPVNQKTAHELLAEAAAAAARRPAAAAVESDLLQKAKALAVEKELVLLLESGDTSSTAELPSAGGLRDAAAAAGGHTGAAASEKAAAAGRRGAAAGRGGDADSGADVAPGGAAGATLPCLLVPKNVFVKAGLHALQHCFGESTAAGIAAVDAFRDVLIRETSRRMQQLRQRRLQPQQQLLHPPQDLREEEEEEEKEEEERLPHDERLQVQQQQQLLVGGEVGERADSLQKISSLYYKPYILHYGRQLEQKRREAKQQQQKDSSSAGAATFSLREEKSNGRLPTAASRAARRRYAPRCLQPLPLSAAADWPSAVTGGPPAGAAGEAAAGEKAFPAAGLQRVVTRFDEQIAHYLRKKRQLQHLKQALEDMQQREFCSFHPAVNKTPRYLKELRRQRQAAADTKTEQLQGRRGGVRWLLHKGLATSEEIREEAAAADPMEILALYCKYYTEDPRYEELVQEIQECCFQPNVAKFVRREKKRQQQLQRRETRTLQQLEQKVGRVQQQQQWKEAKQQQQEGQQWKEAEQQQQQRGPPRTENGCRQGISPSQEEQPLISKGDTSAQTAAVSRRRGTAEAAATDRAARRAAAEGQAAAADELFAKLDAPFDSIFDADIRQWLHSRDGSHYWRKQQGRRRGARRSFSSSSSAPMVNSSLPAAAAGAGEATTSESSGEESQQEQQQNEWRNWIREGRQPQYRGPRQRNSKGVLLAALLDGRAAAAENPLAAAVAAAVKERTDAAATAKASRLPLSNSYNRWVEGLRGGYLSNPMDFSMRGEDARGEDEKKIRRYCMRNWSRYIRLEQRAVEARVLPNRDVANALCEAYMPSADLPGPTLWTPSRSRWKPREESNPSAYTYTQANYCGSVRTNGQTLPRESACSSVKQPPGGLLLGRQTRRGSAAAASHAEAALAAPVPSGSKAASYVERRQQELQQLQSHQPQQQGVSALLRMSRSGDKSGVLQDARAATFVLPTPVKTHRIREQFRVYVQLRHGIDTGEICVPPSVCAVKRKDVLETLEKELEEEVPQLVLLSQSPKDLAAAAVAAENGRGERKRKKQQQQQQAAAAKPAGGNNRPDGTDTTRHQNAHEQAADEKEYDSSSCTTASTAAAEGGAEDEIRNASEATEARRTAETPATAEEQALLRPSQRVLLVY